METQIRHGSGASSYHHQFFPAPLCSDLIAVFLALCSHLIVAHDSGAFGYHPHHHQFFRLPFAQICDKIKVLVVAVVRYGFGGIGELMDEFGGGRAGIQW
ncbi:hypothetical protein HanIR_Chr15g0785041 [Helianthus annuus]|nr:hypothetical protein HanIR_Chr15g0785041 [Helianthus annuus]